MSIDPIFDQNEDIPEKKFEYVPDFNSTENYHDTETNTEEHTQEVVNLVIEKNDTDEILIEKSVIEDLNNTELPYTDWNDFVDLGHSWYEINWLGMFFSLETPKYVKEGIWIFHIDLGWIFIVSQSFDSVWIWNSKLNCWMWTQSSIFPYFYSNQTDSWIYFNFNKKVYFDYLTNQYLKLN